MRWVVGVAQMEARGCSGAPVVIVDAGNSAGQAALFLARRCTLVTIAIRGESLEASMSRYLIDEIEDRETIRVMAHTEVNRLLGEDRLTGVELIDNHDGRCVSQDNVPAAWRTDGGEDPLLLETSRPGVFAVGDVRSQSIKRAVTAIGEGSMAVRLVFDRLQRNGEEL
jgi:thioredoxin reductase (NADPH)